MTEQLEVHNYLAYKYFFPRCMECQRGLAMRKVSVCLSVCRSVKRVHCDKTEVRSVQIFYTIQKFVLPSFLTRRMIVGSDLFYLKFWVNRPRLERNRRFCTDTGFQIS